MSDQTSEQLLKTLLEQRSNGSFVSNEEAVGQAEKMLREKAGKCGLAAHVGSWAAEAASERERVEVSQDGDDAG